MKRRQNLCTSFSISEIIERRKSLEKENNGTRRKFKRNCRNMNLKNLTSDVDLVEKYVQVPDINRPALQLSGFFDHFDSDQGTGYRIC